MNNKKTGNKPLKKNVRFFPAAALTAMLVSATVLAGCGGVLKPDSVLVDDGGGNGGETSLTVPGSGSQLTAVDLDKSYNGELGKPGIRICNITQAEGGVSKSDITTQETLGLWGDDKFHIEGYSSAWNGTYANAGFTDVSILYYDQAFEAGQEFKFSARVRVQRAGGVSTGKGIHFGAYTTAYQKQDNPLIDQETGAVLFGPAHNSKGVGMFLRCEAAPQFRLYFSDSAASTAAGTGAFGGLTDLKYTKEYIYEIARVKLSDNKWYYTYKLFDSKSGDRVYDSVADTSVAYPAPGGRSLQLDASGSPWGGAQPLSPYLKESVYPGVCISGSAAEISQIKIWNNGNAIWDYKTNSGDTPIFSTPDTIPAYVPAQYFNAIVMQGKQRNPTVFSQTGENLYTWTSDTDSNLQWGGIVNNGYVISIDNLKSYIMPTYSEDNIRFQFLTMQGHPAFTIEGVGKENVAGGVSEAYRSGKITIDPSKMTSGTAARAYYKIVARDPWLDIVVPGKPEGINAPDYSLKQTLPEYYFTVVITKP